MLPHNTVSLRAATAADLSIIHQLAHEIWWPTYGEYLADDQITLMLDLIYSENALRSQLDEGQHFSLAIRGETPVGFVGFLPKRTKPQTMRIEKLYVKSTEQGSGIGKQLINHVGQIALLTDCLFLELNVNRNNPAVQFYRRQGFIIIDTEDIPYHGYILNDYVMQKELLGV